MRCSPVARFCAGVVLALCLTLSAPPALQAAGAGKSEGVAGGLTEKIAKSDSPINIQSDRMEAKQEERLILFDGHVVVQQDDMTLNANKLKVVLLAGEKNPAGPTDRIDYIEAEGGVKVTHRDRLATAAKAIFYQKERKIVLHGHPIVMKGNDKIEGTLITIYLKEGRSVVEGGKGTPVQAVLFPGKKD
ncbi:MAG: hypothetical protein LLG06_20940 [Desulfobacteraceae bacterium]|nr:hypothetical protein [Desulfobacteraceae bacterium]